MDNIVSKVTSKLHKYRMNHDAKYRSAHIQKEIKREWTKIEETVPPLITAFEQFVIQKEDDLKKEFLEKYFREGKEASEHETNFLNDLYVKSYTKFNKTVQGYKHTVELKIREKYYGGPPK
jgi:hypothetical protein